MICRPSGRGSIDSLNLVSKKRVPKRQWQHTCADWVLKYTKASGSLGFCAPDRENEPTQAVVKAARAQSLETHGNRDTMSFSEDFAHFAAAVAGCYLLLGNGETGPHGQPLYSADYDFNDALLQIGRDLWVQLVRDRLPVSHGK